MKIIKPPALKSGDTLGIVACSTPISVASSDVIDTAYARLRERGFNLVEAQNCRKMVGHSAGTIQERVDVLHRFFANNGISGIISFWGGFQSHQLLEYLDFDLIRKNPKALIGFSDFSSLQVAISSRTGLVTYSGPAGITFGKPNFPDFSWKYFDEVLMNPKTPLSIKPSKEYSENPWFMEASKEMVFKNNPGWKVFREGQAEGRILGGNLGTLLLLAGTEFWPDLQGKILFVEDDEAETPKTMDRMFTQLRQMGVFRQIAGMVIGRFHSAVQFSEEDSLEMILADVLRGCKFPVITGVDFGHTDPLITIPNGISCKINSNPLEITYMEKAVT